MAASNNLVQAFALNQFSTGRRLFTFNEVVRLSRKLKLKSAKLKGSLERAIANDLETRRLEGQWREAKVKTKTGRGRSAAVGNRVKRAIGGLHQTLIALIDEDEDDDDERARAAEAQALLDKHLPEGAAAITNQDAEDLLSAVEEMNGDFARLSKTQRERLNITIHVDRLAKLATLFATELGRSPANMEFKELSTARASGHEALCKLVSTIISPLVIGRGEYQEEDPETVETRAALLAPVFAQNTKISERRKTSPAPDVDVDPDTGEEIERPAPDAGEDEEEPVA